MAMLNTLKHWWEGESFQPASAPEISLTITKLMVGMMAMDGKLDASERVEINYLLREHYGLTAFESEELIEQCVSGQADDLRIDHIVKQIVGHYTLHQRTEMVRQIWQVALADGVVDFNEEQYINRLSGLLGLSTDQLTQAKQGHYPASTIIH